jgi:hypothetical protein
MNTSQLLLKSKRKLCGAVAASLLIGISPTPATQTVRELFDKIGNSDYITLNGQGGGATSVGLQGTWTASPNEGAIQDTNGVYVPTPSTGIVYKDTWSLDWPLDNLEYGGVLLGHGGGQNGLLNFNAGGNLNTLTDTNTGLPYGNYTSLAYATRPLTPAAQIDFKANGTYYFSVRIVKSYPWWVGDTAAGVGFSTGSDTTNRFVGVGVTRPTLLADDQVTYIGDASYISVGTLGQDGFPSNPYGSGGPYYPSALGAAGTWTNAAAGARTNALGEFDGTCAGLLVGRLTTTISGNATLDVKAYLPKAPIYTNIVGGITNYTLEADINNITWEATHNFTESNVMTHLLVWMHGQNVLEYDAIRVGTTFGDVTGFELIGAPKGSPANTVYEGVDVTISQLAGVNSGSIPMSFQWRSNGVDIVDATNATLVLVNPTTDMTANYSVTVSNFYGGPVTSPETLITINPGVEPFFVLQPQPAAITRYAGAPSAQFSVVVNGTPPFTYQWQHAGTNIGAATTTANVTNTLTIAPITLAEAGNYTVTITNAYGTTNSAAATLNVIEPAANSYATALLSLPTNPTNLFGYWRMDDNATTNDPAIREYWNGHNGLVSIQDLNNGRISPGVEGAPYPAFLTPHWATAIGTTTAASPPEPWNYPYRVDLKNLPSAQTNMTFTMWVKGGVRLMARNGYGQGYGLRNDAGNIRFQWGAYDSTNGVKTATWDTGLVPPADQWTFVALVVEGTNATVYMGSKTSFTSATSADQGGLYDPENGGFMTIVPSTILGESNLRFGVGRNPIPWADDGNGAPWESVGGTWSDIGVFYQVLTPAQIKGLFVAGAGLWIEGTPDGIGNLNLNWLTGFTLQEASNVTGPWTDIGAATPPNYAVPISTIGNKFYRVKPVSF